MASDEHHEQADGVYRAFLLRAWAESEGKDRCWRFQLANTEGETVDYFSDLRSVMEYVEQELGIDEYSGTGDWQGDHD